MRRVSGDIVEGFDPHEGPYSAILPRNLPPDPPLQTERLWVGIEGAAQALGRLQDVGKRVPNTALMLLYPSIREAHASAGVEGTTTTLAEALGIVDIGEDEQKRADYIGIRNHLDSQRHAIRTHRERGLTLEILLEAHSTMVRADDRRRVQPGIWRTKQNYLPGEVRGYASARYIPPPPEHVKPCMKALESFWREPGSHPDLVVAALIHGQVELIHPFADGNGRIGRMLILLYLLESRRLQLPLLFLSDYFRVNRTEYFELLGAVAQDGQWEDWIAFFLEGVRQVADAAVEVAEEIIGLHSRLHAELAKVHRGPAGQALLEYLFQAPRMTVKEVADTTGLGIANINTAVRRFDEQGWLRQTTPGRRNRTFVFQIYWDTLCRSGQLATTGRTRDSG